MGSSAAATESDEPLSPAGRLFLQPQMNQVIHCLVGFQNPIDVDSIKSQIKSSLLLTHPRFSSLMLLDSRHQERWRKTHIDLDRHVIVLPHPVVPTTVDHETAVNSYLADLSSSLLPYDKPLWEFHLLLAHNVMILRVHHALGDGISLMSMFLASCRRCDDVETMPTLTSGKRKKNRENKGWLGLVCGVVAMVWWSLVFVVGFCLRCLWLCDRKTEMSGGDGVELWPRKLATAKFRLQDMKVVKRAVPNAVS